MSTDTEAIFRMMVLRESVASTALSHEDDCGCDICRAAQGDYEAWVRIVERIQALRDAGQ